MSVFQVNSETLATTASAANASIAAIQGEIATLNGRCAELASVWTGAAATAFNGAIEQWRGAERVVEEALASLSRALIAAGQSYAEVEQANMALFSR
ncbi:MAG: WXG100 family type VII secretion target [Bifidobacteriaceae bacterium]|jgi:WXG100 family type VII secretion target|nr:WXG100 family type VII secretion target [Bifidobacteriaceae bacterium]